MNIEKKIEILAGAAKYDASCSTSGSRRKNDPNGMGNAAYSGICHSWGDDGRCISLLKILLSNYCIYDCAYCMNRRSNDIERASFTVDEIVNLTMDFYKRNYIEGLFLSSGVFVNPDNTMEKLLLVVKKLRIEKKFNGYIHLKVIPGASQELIRLAGLYADRVSVNIELPSEQSLNTLAPEKKKEDIVKPMGMIKEKAEENRDERKKIRSAPLFAPAGQSTQMIIGATPENDKHIITLSENMYKRFDMRRVYYSAYIPVNEDKRISHINTPPLLRENRLYQADWLLRFYGFKADEILDDDSPDLADDVDPKTGWALRNIHQFPVEINKVEYEMLLRVPGIGVKSAQRIIAARRFERLSFDHLKKMGVVLKRARYFITCQGKYIDKIELNSPILRILVSDKNNGKVNPYQLKLF